jgi:hypothetical protein
MKHLPVLLIMLLCGCNPPRQLNWTFIVPAGYQGYVVMRWACPGGIGLVATNGTITVPFSQAATFCTSNTSSATLSPNGDVGQIACRDTTGKPIPFVGVPWAPVTPMPALALMGGDNLALDIGGKQYEFFVFWVGNPASFPTATAQQAQLDSFLSQRFEVPTYRKP